MASTGSSSRSRRAQSSHPCLQAFQDAANGSSNPRLRKIVGSLSWRGRHSQADFFPFEICGRSVCVCSILIYNTS